MQEVFEKIIEEIDNRIKTQIKIMAGLAANETYRYGFGKSLEAYEQSKLIVEQAAAEYNDGWIPADKPPEDDSYILLSFSNVLIPFIGRYKEEDGGGAYYIWDETKSCVSQDMVVNAWQPLPKPYQPNKQLRVKAKKQTNADRIHSMSVEELAELLPIASNLMCTPTDKCMENICNRGECENTKECALKWLRSEAEGLDVLQI